MDMDMKKLEFPSYERYLQNSGKMINHIYIISDEEIVEGDWFICISAQNWIPTPWLCGGVASHGYRQAYATNCYTPTKKDYRKIVFSTNPMLQKGFESYPNSKLQAPSKELLASLNN
jgi:hypothetical protein